MLKNRVGTPALHEVFIKVKGELRIVDEELRDMPKVISNTKKLFFASNNYILQKYSAVFLSWNGVSIYF